MKTLIVKSIGAYLNTLAYFSPAKAGERAFQLFCRPIRSAITQKQNEFFNTAEKFTVEIDGHVSQGYRWGKGNKKILFLHGWQSHTYRWKPYIEALDKDEFTVYSIDAPGHGLSPGNFLSVPVYSQVIEALIHQLGSVHAVVGHSLGSFSLLYTLYRLPLLPVRRVVLMAPPGEASDFVSVFQSTLGLSNRILDLVADQFVERYSFGPDYFSTIKFAASLNMSGLIIHDEEDIEAPYKYSIPLQKAWPKSRLITTKGFGHNLRSMSVVKDVVEFIDEPVHQPAF